MSACRNAPTILTGDQGSEISLPLRAQHLLFLDSLSAGVWAAPPPLGSSHRRLLFLYLFSSGGAIRSTSRLRLGTILLRSQPIRGNVVVT